MAKQKKKFSEFFCAFKSSPEVRIYELGIYVYKSLLSEQYGDVFLENEEQVGLTFLCD